MIQCRNCNAFVADPGLCDLCKARPADPTTDELKAEIARLTNVNACLINDTVLMGLARDSYHEELQSAERQIVQIQEERDAAVKFIGIVQSHFIEAGFRSGDRMVCLENVINIIMLYQNLRDAAR